MDYTDNIIEKICSDRNIKILYNESMKRHTSFNIGGECKAFISVNSVEGLQDLIKAFKENNVKYTVVGKGSNLLVSDDGFDGYVLNLGRDFASISLKDENTIIAYAGATLRNVGNFALENDLKGMECLHGIPGSVGGAVYMNAGAYGGEIKDCCVCVTAMTRDGEIKTYKTEEMDFSYRHSVFSENDEIVLSAEFALEKGSHDEIKAKMDELADKRKSKQPLEYPSAGSTFKRPVGSFASLLIDECGLKGMNVGDAEVSTKHSGFVINKGNATCKDVLTLCDKIIEIVKQEKGFDLELEPVILGEV